MAALDRLVCVLDEATFRRCADAALESLKKVLIRAEIETEFEVEERDGALHIAFDEPPAIIMLTANIPVRQIWISAVSTSFQLDWDELKHDFVLARTGETLQALVARLMREEVGSDIVLG